VSEDHEDLGSAEIRWAIHDIYDLLVKASAAKAALAWGPVISLTDRDALERIEGECVEWLARLRRREMELSRAERARSRKGSGGRRKSACPAGGTGLG
jgi:hypothetical protein